MYNIKVNNSNPKILTLQNHQSKSEVSRAEYIEPHDLTLVYSSCTYRYKFSYEITNCYNKKNLEI